MLTPDIPCTNHSKILQYFLATRSKRKNLLFLVGGMRQAAAQLMPSSTQLTLQLITSQRPSVVRLAPRNCYSYLNHGVHDVFKTVPSVTHAAIKLERRGIFVLGQLVQMSEDDLRRFPFLNAAIVEDMKSHLATVNLAFGMRAPAWNRSFRSQMEFKL